MAQLRSAITAWAAGGVHADAAQAEARALGERVGLRSVVLVEGVSDRVAVESLAARIGRGLDAEGVCVVPMGGAMSIRRFLDLFGATGLDIQVAGLCDLGEEPYFQRALERAGRGVDLDRQRMQSLGFYVCVVDLEDELISSLGASTVLKVLEAEGDDRTFHTFQRQPAQRARPIEQQLRRFMGTISGRKERYAGSLVGALDLERMPHPLELLLARV
jgi:OLD-like protein